MNSPTISTSSQGRKTSSRPGSVPLVITSFSMKDQEAVDGVSHGHSPILLCPVDLDLVLGQMKDCDAIKYAAYRAASKLDILRSALRLDQVKLGAVTSVFQKHGFRSAMATNDQMFSMSKANDVVADVFFSAGKIRSYFSPTLDIPACTEAVVKAAFMIYGDENVVGVAFLKVFFTILCDSRLKDKLAYLYKDFSTLDKGLMTKNGVKLLLTELTRISEFLNESASFGNHLVKSAVAQCFQMAGNQAFLDEDGFFKWIFKEPQVIVWLPTFYRLVAAKSIRHDVRCANCKLHAIIGMRYQCLQCLNYDLCQHCFFYGLVSRNHKVSHPMQEYCYKSTRKDATRALIKLMANNMGLVNVKEGGPRRFLRKKHIRRRYLPHDPDLALEKTLDGSMDEQPITVEALNLQPLQPNVLAKFGSEGCSSGFHSVSSTSQSPVNNYETAKAAKGDVAVYAKIGPPDEDTLKRQNQLATILQRMELENAAVLERLTHLQASGDLKTNQQKGDSGCANTTASNRPRVNDSLYLSQPIDSCVAMQVQLERLKLLMEGLFGSECENDAADKRNGSETPFRSKKQIISQRQSILMELQNSLAEPSLVESTPLFNLATVQARNAAKCSQAASQFQRKKLSKLALDNNFSPIVYQVPKSAPLERKAPPVFDESVIVDTMLNKNEDEGVDECDNEYSTDGLATTPSLSNVTMGDLTSILAKTGHQQNVENDLNITKQLLTEEEENEIANCQNGGELMDEMERLMEKMETVFATFIDPTLVKKTMPIVASQTNLGNAPETDPSVIGQLVAEISDQIHSQAQKENDAF